MARPWPRWLSRIAIVLAVVVAAMALLWAIWWLWSLLSPQWDTRTIIAIAITALVPLAAIWWLWWRLPQRQVARLALKIRDPKARADVEDNFRKTVGQALGGAAVLIGVGAAYMQFTQQQRAGHDLFISNQVSKGGEQLASKELVVRLGGIYALEGVMNTSEQYYYPVLGTLCAFVREGTKTHDGKDAPATDIAAALAVIASRPDKEAVVDLSSVRIPKASMRGAALSFARLAGADLSGVDFKDAVLIYADLTRANLSGSRLDYADLTHANLTHANLIGVFFGITILRGADLTGANLAGVTLLATNLQDATLKDANLRGAILQGATLRGADLTATNLTGADLTGLWDPVDQKQLDAACGTDAKLPKGRTLKPCL